MIPDNFAHFFAGAFFGCVIHGLVWAAIIALRCRK